MMLRTDRDHLPWAIRGKQSEHYRAGRTLTLILHGPHTRADFIGRPNLKQGALLPFAAGASHRLPTQSQGSSSPRWLAREPPLW